MTGTSAIATDLRNPGQFFACCGMLYCADRLLGDAAAHFEGDTFVLRAGETDPALSVMRRLENCPASVNAETDDTDSPVSIDDVPVRLDFWNHFDDRPQIKLFAGQIRSKPLVGRWARLLSAYCQRGGGMSAWTDFSTVSLPSGIDAATRWTAQDVGFSLNEQGMKEMRTYPLVEFFAHVGVQSYSWREVERGRYAYYTWDKPLPMPVAAAAASGAIGRLASRKFVFSTGRNGANKAFNMSREAPL